MRWMDDTPYTTIDFGPGDYRFKKQLSNAVCMVGHGFAGRPGAATLVRSAAYGLRGVAEAGADRLHLVVGPEAAALNDALV